MFIRRTAIILTLALLAAAASALPGVGATDTTPPVWQKKVAASVPIGAKLSGPSSPLWCSPELNNEYGLRVNLDYRASDPESGIDRYEMSGMFSKDLGTATRTGYTATTYIGHACGGGSNAFTMYAYNGAGLESPPGGGYSDGTLYVSQEAPSASVTYSGSWSISNCTCWSGGTTRKTTQKGASVTYRISSPMMSNAGKPVDDGAYAVALIMPKGPDRGTADIFIDGTKVGAVNTYSASRINGTVVWRQTLNPGSHTIRVVNQATTGHSRIDIDAFAFFSKSG